MWNRAPDPARRLPPRLGICLPVRSCPLNHRADHRGYPQLWRSECAPLRNRPVWPSDPGLSHELQACKLPTVWITPVDNSCETCAQHPTAAGDWWEMRSKGTLAAARCGTQRQAVGNPKKDWPNGEPKDQPPLRGGCCASVAAARKQCGAKGGHGSSGSLRRGPQGMARSGGRGCSQRGAEGGAPRGQDPATRRAETAISRARTKSRPPACSRP